MKVCEAHLNFVRTDPSFTIFQTEAVELFTFDFGEESSALSAISLQRQGEFVANQMRLLVDSRMKKLHLEEVRYNLIANCLIHDDDDNNLHQ